MYSMLECDTVIYIKQSVQYERVWYRYPYVTKCTVWKSVIQWSICSKMYGMLECDLHVTKCTVWKSVIQWSICSKMYGMLECDLYVTECTVW